MTAALDSLKERYARIARLREVCGLLEWDQQTYMPPGATEARGEQSAVLTEMAHTMLASEDTGTLLAQSERDAKGLDEDSDTVRMLAALRRDYDHATKLPSDLVAEMARHAAVAHSIWHTAKQTNDFALFAPALERMFELTRRAAECLGYTDHIYDALIDSYEPGAKQADVARMFDELRPGLVELTRRIVSSGRQVDDSLLQGDFPIDDQRKLTLKLVEALGFDFCRGRQDEAAHPFCSNFSRDDVRLTTRFNPKYLGQALYASLHEAGHGMYEQGLPPAYEQTPLGSAASLGVHESQSRLWENLVGRSRAFAKFAFPLVRDAFPSISRAVSAEEFYRSINKVEPSLIRIEADEVTYNLHIMLRFELECDLLTGALPVRDLPGAWNAKIQDYLGITPPDDAHGVLQDVHWSGGLIGYFPTYSIGNLLASQLWKACSKAIPAIDEQISHGEFEPLLSWLRANVHAHARKYLPGELAVKATGEPIGAAAYLDYLNTKFGAIYGL
jgi:carboxypeptidase Taq